MQAHLEKLRAETINCERIAELATDTAKRDLFTRLAQHYRILASEWSARSKMRSRIIKRASRGLDELLSPVRITSPYE